MRKTSILILLGITLSCTPFTNTSCQGNDCTDNNKASHTHQPVNSELQHVHLIFHHGDRSSMHPIPEIYNNFQEVWPQGLGKLTGIGVRQQFLLGQWLRRKYGHFIPETYTSSTYRIKSMKKDRSLMSAMANSAGFYSQSLSPLDEFNVHWSPVPVHILPHPSDFLRGIDRCPRLNSLKYLRMHMHDSIKLERQHKSLFTMLTNVTGLHVDRFNIGKLADFLKCMKGSNVSLPGWCTEQVLHEIFEVDNFYWTEKYAKSLEVARLQSGLLFHSIVEHINRIIREKSINLPNNIKMSNKHMMVYSVDDIHVASILTAFRISNNKTIEYASVVSLEVYGPPEPVDASQLIVKLFYKRGWEDENGEYLSMPICYAGEFLDGCPLHVVLERLESLAIHPKYYAVECSPLLAEKNNGSNTTNIWEKPQVYGYFAFFIASFFLLLLLNWLIVRQRKQK